MAHAQIELAPAAGAGVGKMLAESLLQRPDFLPAMEAAAMAGLRATVRRWDKDTDDWIVDPDCKTQATWFFGLVAHMEGEPIKRIIHQHIGPGRGIDPADALRESPELAAAVARELEKAQWRKGGGERSKARAAQRAEVVDVTPDKGAAGAF